MKKLFDLRFVIGLFFSVVGILLLLYHFLVNTTQPENHKINLYSGMVYLLFGVVMIVLSYKNKLS
ncbi:MAG: hypothetical protein KGZ59_03080 [Chitinophagaceae bacterium]|nr:hypothetical protein [Chitinophagaceae bacterium]